HEAGEMTKRFARSAAILRKVNQVDPAFAGDHQGETRIDDLEQLEVPPAIKEAAQRLEVPVKAADRQDQLAGLIDDLEVFEMGMEREGVEGDITRRHRAVKSLADARQDDRAHEPGDAEEAEEGVEADEDGNRDQEPHQPATSSPMASWAFAGGCVLGRRF